MIPHLDTYRTAAILVEHHGDDASIRVTVITDAMRNMGDLEGYEVWKGILKAVEELLREEPGDGERVN